MLLALLRVSYLPPGVFVWVVFCGFGWRCFAVCFFANGLTIDQSLEIDNARKANSTCGKN